MVAVDDYVPVPDLVVSFHRIHIYAHRQFSFFFLLHSIENISSFLSPLYCLLRRRLSIYDVLRNQAYILNTALYTLHCDDRTNDRVRWIDSCLRTVIEYCLCSLCIQHGGPFTVISHTYIFT